MPWCQSERVPSRSVTVAVRTCVPARSVETESGLPWPAMPAALQELWREGADHPALPEACLVNLYRGTARMGLHQDRDEHDLSAPVVSVSLGIASSARRSFTDHRGLVATATELKGVAKRDPGSSYALDRRSGAF